MSAEKSAAAPADAAGADEAKAPAAPIFGAAATFGAGGGFGGFAGLAAKAADAPAALGGGDAAAAAGDEDGDEPAPEEECKAEFKPLVQLEEVEVTSGEEDEEALFDYKCKFYRFDAGAGEWKERGIGQARLLRHKAHGRVRFLMREATTLKVRANHLVLPSTTVKEHEGSEKAAVWSCVDFAEGEQRPEMFCARFASAERAAEFRAAYGDAAAHNAPLLAAAGEGGEESEGETGEEAAAAAPSAADEAADALAKATVADAAEPEAAA